MRKLVSIIDTKYDDFLIFQRFTTGNSWDSSPKRAVLTILCIWRLAENEGALGGAVTQLRSNGVLFFERVERTLEGLDRGDRSYSMAGSFAPCLRCLSHVNERSFVAYTCMHIRSRLIFFPSFSLLFFLPSKPSGE